jgi:hypothetical protein
LQHHTIDESGRVGAKANMIIWDEAPMMHHRAFEIVDRTLRDLM